MKFKFIVQVIIAAVSISACVDMHQEMVVPSSGGKTVISVNGRTNYVTDDTPTEAAINHIMPQVKEYCPNGIIPTKDFHAEVYVPTFVKILKWNGPVTCK